MTLIRGREPGISDSANESQGTYVPAAAPASCTEPGVPLENGSFARVSRFFTARAALAVLVVAALVFGVSGWLSASHNAHKMSTARRQLAAVTRGLGELKESQAASSAASRDLLLRLGRLEAAAAASVDPSKLASAAQPSVFTLETNAALGTAWVASSRSGVSRLITNFHVVADTYVNGGRSVKVRSGNHTYDATIEQTSAADDLAVLSVKVALPVLSIQPTEPAPGDPVLVIGSPLGLGGTVATGIVSAVRTEDGVRYIQFSAPISPGNSGSPVLDRKGRVIGVAEAKATGQDAEGLSFAVPAKAICNDFDVC